MDSFGPPIANLEPIYTPIYTPIFSSGPPGQSCQRQRMGTSQCYPCNELKYPFLPHYGEAECEFP